MKTCVLAVVLILIQIISFHADAQSKNELGLSMHLERSPEVTTKIPPGAYKITKGRPESIFALSYERLFTRHSGLALEVKFRKSRNELQIPLASGASNIQVLYQTAVENIISLPLMYRYHSCIVNISAGPTVEYFISARQPDRYAPPLGDYKTYFVEQELSFGVLVGISKTLPATSKLLIEPGLYYNRVLSFNRSYYGASLAAKYRF
jgi:hypothetical protein